MYTSSLIRIFNHANIATYCQRPENFTEILLRNLRNTLTAEDLLIHLGDVFIGPVPPWLCDWPGRKALIRGNHDRNHSVTWWMEHGFDTACDGMRFRNCWLTHEPDTSRAGGCDLNVHGHLHNIWHGFHEERMESPFPHRKALRNEWQRLFAVEYTNYMPVEFNKFISRPDKYQSRGPANED
jgi:calcineurin-like phosphoesterase family protein